MGGRTRWVIVLAVSSLGLTGCPLVWLGAGVAGGYAISKDSVRNQFDISQERLFAQSLKVAKEMGFVTVEDQAHGTIHTKIQDTNVTITIRPLTKKAVEVKVKARNHLLMPEIDVAQSVYSKIIEGLK